MAVNDVDHARLAAAQEKLGRPATPEDVAVHLGRRAVQLRLDPVVVEVEAEVEPEAEPEVEPVAAPRRRGRPPKVRTEA